MKLNKIAILSVMVIAAIFIGCSSQEFTSAKLYVQQKNLEKAEEFFLLALEREPMNPEVPFMLARDVYGQQEKYDLALKYLDESLKRGPLFEEDVKKLKEYYWQKSYNEGLKYYGALQNGTATDTAKVLELALKNFEAAKNLNATDERAYFQLARMAELYMKDDAKGMAYVEEGLENAENANLLKEHKARKLLTAGDKDGALVLYKDVMESDSDRAGEAGKMYARILLDDQRYAEAETAFQSIVNENPDNPDNYFNLGFLYVRMATAAKENEDEETATLYYENAKNQFETVLAMNPGDQLVLEAVGDLYSELKDNITAEYYYQQLVDQDPMNANFLKKLGRAIYLQGRQDEGQALWDQAKALE